MRFYPLAMDILSMNSTATSNHMTVPWTAGDATRAIFLVVGASVLAMLGVTPLVRMFGGSDGVQWFLLAVVLEGLLLLAAWQFGPRRYGWPLGALGLKASLNNGVPLALLVFVAILAFSTAYLVAVSLLGLEELIPPRLEDLIPLDTYPQRLTAFFLVVALAPIAEEVFFRGYLLPVFVDRWGAPRGMAFVSLLFGISHVAPGLIIQVFVSGLLLAWLYRRTGSLWNCCLAHGALNALGFAVAVVA